MNSRLVLLCRAVCVGIGVLLSGTTVILAQEQAEVTLKAVVGPTVEVRALNQTIDLTPSGHGTISANIYFQLNCNVSTLGLELLVTHLYHDNDPASPSYLPVATNEGVQFLPAAAQAINDTLLSTGYAVTEELTKASGSFAGHRTNRVELESTQADGLLHQELSVTATWQQPDDMPSGSYTGYAVLYISML